jgi:hypothetical protein
MFGLNAEQGANARLRVFLELPPKLRRSFYDSIRVGAGTRALRAVVTVDRDPSGRQLRFGQGGGAA